MIPGTRPEQLIAISEKYAPNVKFINETNKIENFVAGVPFPSLDIENDPKAGWKLAYNIVYSGFLGDVLSWPTLDFVMVSQEGYERSITYSFSLYQMLGRRSSGDNHIEGNGEIRSLTKLIATSPADVRGVGSFATRYADGRLDDVYVYIRAVRRFRRVSGGSWYDPVQGSDFLLDQTSNAFNADPIWYKDFRLLEKRIMLSPETTTAYYASGESSGSPQEKYPKLDLDTPPYWNYTDENEYWRPREIYVLEAIPPKGHPNSRRIVYVDADPYMPLPFAVDNYDRAGNLWTVYSNTAQRVTTADGHPTVNPVIARMVDLKSLRATLLPSGPGRVVNPPGVTAQDFNLESVRKLIE